MEKDLKSEAAGKRGDETETPASEHFNQDEIPTKPDISSRPPKRDRVGKDGKYREIDREWIEKRGGAG